MLPSLLLTFREGLEAALIVGIMLGYLTRIGQADRHRTIWAGVGGRPRRRPYLRSSTGWTRAPFSTNAQRADGTPSAENR